MQPLRDFIASREYEERVYAGVLGKIAGVYLGRPFEQWSHERIERELGEVNYYVHEKLGAPLIVTDDDITGTFAFVRALKENGYPDPLAPEAIGDWWLNTIIEGRTILWWGGMGLSTEHTAYLRLKQGVRAPESGSIARNGVAVAEEIGAQIFIDGWGMICPGDPERAVDYARRAGSVSHDGEAIYGAQAIAAMEALAFVEPDLDRLLDTAVSMIPSGSLIAELYGAMRQWTAAHGDDWRATLRKVREVYPYSRFGTNCPMVSNHAIVLLGLLHGGDDFQRALTITNTAGYDTDCNSANVGCLLGIKNGLAGIDRSADWRGPVADRLYLPTADGGRAITDALRETYALVEMGRTLAGLPHDAPKGGARFHFSLPGSVQGFQPDGSPDSRGTVVVDNRGGKLALTLDRVTVGRPARASTPTFIPPDALNMPGYALLASPTLYGGQVVTADVLAADISCSVRVGLYVAVYDENDALRLLRAAPKALSSGEASALTFVVPDTGGQPVAAVGIEVTSDAPASGLLLVDRLTWTGTPTVTLGAPEKGGSVWRRAWVNAAEQFQSDWVDASNPYLLVQNQGVGLVTQGADDWTDYTVSATILPRLSSRSGLLACVHGLRRYVGVVLDEDKRVRLIEQCDRERRVLAEWEGPWEFGRRYSLSLTVTESGIAAEFDGVRRKAVASEFATAMRGAVGLMVESGCVEFGAVAVRPA
jgi:ADP-ribosylglycohydrolase